jgi:hypothetical protein
MSLRPATETTRCRASKTQGRVDRTLLLIWMGVVSVLVPGSVRPARGGDFQVQVYTSASPPPTPGLQALPLLSQVAQDGITWTFSQPQRVGRFVNGDYYVVGPATVVDIQPLPTPANGLHGSMLNIRPNIQRSGFDSRIDSGRYDSTLRVYPPITLMPGNNLISSRSVGATNPPSVMRPFDISASPVASVSILPCVAGPQPPDAFRPSYAQGATNIYLSRNLRRQLLPRLTPVAHIPPFSEFEGYLRRPWVDSVFFNFDVAVEYMPSYGRENGFLMSFAGLLLTLDFPAEQKEPLLVYLVQYGIDLSGLVQQGHTGWQAWGGHGSGRKLPIVFAGVLLGEDQMKSVQADFGEDLQTIWVTQTPPAGTYTQSWHSHPESVVYGGHIGINGESVNPGWGPYEHLVPSAWKNTVGESYRRCCTSVCWVGEALAARLVPGMQAAWNHPQFFAYVDRWMFSPDDPADLATIQSATGMTIDSDFMQGQSWKILSGGGYYQPHRTFVDEMWAAYRQRPRITSVASHPDSSVTFTVENLTPNKTNFIQVTADLSSMHWTTIRTNVPAADTFLFLDPPATNRPLRFYRVQEAL